MTNTIPVRTANGAIRRDKVELRAAVQDAVFDHCVMRREKLGREIMAKEPGLTGEELSAKLDELQPLYVEFDPVVMLSVMAADHRYSAELRRSAASDAAQYLRPKLKAIEMLVRPEDEQERSRLVGALRGLLDTAASAKRATIDGEAREVGPSPAAPDVDEST